MEMHDWARIASDIEKWYSVYDGFVIIHGTGTFYFFILYFWKKLMRFNPLNNKFNK